MSGEHTRNQKRMYRIHKLEEKIQAQDLLIGSLQQRIDKAIEYINTMTDSTMADQVYDIWYSNKEYLLSILKGE